MSKCRKILPPATVLTLPQNSRRSHIHFRTAHARGDLATRRFLENDAPCATSVEAVSKRPSPRRAFHPRHDRGRKALMPTRFVVDNSIDVSGCFDQMQAAGGSPTMVAKAIPFARTNAPPISSVEPLPPRVSAGRPWKAPAPPARRSRGRGQRAIRRADRRRGKR